MMSQWIFPLAVDDKSQERSNDTVYVCSCLFPQLWGSSEVKKSNHPKVCSEESHTQTFLYVHAHVVHRERQLSSMMSGNIVCPGVRGCLPRVQIPLSWRLHACPCVWSHWPTCCHSFIIKSRQGAWPGVDGEVTTVFGGIYSIATLWTYTVANLGFNSRPNGCQNVRTCYKVGQIMARCNQITMIIHLFIQHIYVTHNTAIRRLGLL